MAKKVKKSSHVTPVLAAAAAFLVGGTIWFSTSKQSSVQVPTYEAIRVFDGDTFETKEKQYIRISGIDAPEMGRCGSEEAKSALEKLILGKKLYIKIVYHIDSRMMGLVYTDTGSVGDAMLTKGWAVKNDKEAIHDPNMQEATDTARKKKIGIFSNLCTQTENPTQPTCNIKGNIVAGDQKTFHTPDCQSYSFTSVQLYNGDQWFCTEEEAIGTGFQKASQCK